MIMEDYDRVADLEIAVANRMTLSQASQLWGAVLYLAWAVDCVVRETNGEFTNAETGEPITVRQVVEDSAKIGGFVWKGEGSGVKHELAEGRPDRHDAA